MMRGDGNEETRRDKSKGEEKGESDRRSREE